MVTKDYFKILGVPEKATDEQVRKAYMQLAKKWHPDKNQKPGADDKFKEILAAYTALKDENGRKRYIRDNVKSPTPTPKKPTPKPKTPEPQTRHRQKSKPRDNSTPSNGYHNYKFYKDDDFEELFDDKPGTSKKWRFNVPEPEVWEKSSSDFDSRRHRDHIGEAMSELVKEFMKSLYTDCADQWPKYMGINITDIPTFRRQFTNFDTSKMSDDKKKRWKKSMHVFETYDDDDMEPRVSCPYCNKKLPLLDMMRHEPVCKDLADITVKVKDDDFSDSHKATGNWRDTHEQLINDIKKAKAKHKNSVPESVLIQCPKCKLKYSKDSVPHKCQPYKSGNTYTRYKSPQPNTKTDTNCDGRKDYKSRRSRCASTSSSNSTSDGYSPSVHGTKVPTSRPKSRERPENVKNSRRSSVKSPHETFTFDASQAYFGTKPGGKSQPSPQSGFPQEEKCRKCGRAKSNAKYTCYCKKKD